MERSLFFVCTLTALILTIQLTAGVKLSLRQGPEEPETTEHVLGVNEPQNCTMCPRLYRPICASNGRWYHNSCFMACEIGNNSSVGILYEGICRPEHSSDHPIPIDPVHEELHSHLSSLCERCDKTYYDPVCGTDGTTYRNDCLMNCTVSSDVKIAHTGKCLYSTPVFTDRDHFVATCTTCTRIYDPVCATNDEWYYNSCVMNCTLGGDPDISIKYYGKCINFWRK